jgi:hypothetical protein
MQWVDQDDVVAIAPLAYRPDGLFVHYPSINAIFYNLGDAIAYLHGSNAISKAIPRQSVDSIPLRRVLCEQHLPTNEIEFHVASARRRLPRNSFEIESLDDEGQIVDDLIVVNEYNFFTGNFPFFIYPDERVLVAPTV